MIYIILLLVLYRM